MNGTHQTTSEMAAFSKVNEDLRRCFATWEAADIPPSLALWAAISLLTDTLLNCLADEAEVLRFVSAAMTSVLENREGAAQ